MFKRILILSLILISLAACQTEPPEPLPPTSMKGYELYSWQTEQGWRFSLLVGTNRNKTYDEVVATPHTQAGLENELDYLAEGEMVFWSNRVAEEAGQEKLSFPPEDVIAEIVAYAADLGIIIEVHQP